LSRGPRLFAACIAQMKAAIKRCTWRDNLPKRLR